MAKFAVIKTGGKQYKVAAGDVVKIEKLGDLKQGDSVDFAQVLLIDDGAKTDVGKPFIDGAIVKGEVASVGRNQKVTVIHYKQKSRYFKKAGHKQPHLRVKITQV